MICLGHDCEQPTHQSAGTQLDLITRLADEGVGYQARVKRLETAARKASLIIGHIVAEGWEAPDIAMGIPNESMTHTELEAALAEGE